MSDTQRAKDEGNKAEMIVHIKRKDIAALAKV